MKAIKKFKILWAFICTIVAILLCVAVCREWSAQGCNMLFSKIAGCAVYIAGCVGIYFGGKELAEFINYWFGNGDVYYKQGRK